MCTGPTPCEKGWAKTLTASCPPATAKSVAAGMSVYRLVKANPPTANDFTSPRERRPLPYQFDVPECPARSVSLWDTEERIRAVLKVPLKRKSGMIARLVLGPHCGAIERRDDGHISWWACKAFDPIAATVEVLT